MCVPTRRKWTVVPATPQPCWYRTWYLVLIARASWNRPQQAAAHVSQVQCQVVVMYPVSNHAPLGFPSSACLKPSRSRSRDCPDRFSHADRDDLPPISHHRISSISVQRCSTSTVMPARHIFRVMKHFDGSSHPRRRLRGVWSAGLGPPIPT
jgi:hypothetical protein